MGSLGRAYGSSGSLVIAWVHFGAPRGRKDHSGSNWFTWDGLGFTRARIVVAGYFRVRVGSRVRAKGSPGSLGFAWVHSGAHRCRGVHSGSRLFTWAC